MADVDAESQKRTNQAQRNVIVWNYVTVDGCLLARTEGTTEKHDFTGSVSQ